MNISSLNAIRFGKIIPAGNASEFIQLEPGSRQLNLKLQDKEGALQNFIVTKEDTKVLLGMSQFKSEKMSQMMLKYIKARLGDKTNELNTSSIKSWELRANTPYHFDKSGIVSMGSDPEFVDAYEPVNQTVVTFRENQGKLYNVVATGWDAHVLSGIGENVNKDSDELSQIIFDYVQERTKGQGLKGFVKGTLGRIKWSFDHR